RRPRAPAVGGRRAGRRDAAPRAAPAARGRPPAGWPGALGRGRRRSRLAGRSERLRGAALRSRFRSRRPARRPRAPAEDQLIAMTTTNSTLLYRPALYKHFHRIAWLAVALAACVIVFGAFVRLSNAGLSCPDWPTCYG